MARQILKDVQTKAMPVVQKTVRVALPVAREVCRVVAIEAIKIGEDILKDIRKRLEKGAK